MNLNLKRLKLMRTAARVQRLHTIPTIYRQSVGEHTFGLVALIYAVCDSPSSNLIKAAMFHDASEGLTGDIPAPMKWHEPTFETACKLVEGKIATSFELEVHLSAMERGILKFCDAMELVIYSCEEADMGHKTMMVVARNSMDAIRQRALTTITPRAAELYVVMDSYIESRYDLTHGEDTLTGMPSYEP